MKLNRAAIYVRCSTVQQNLEIQTQDLQRYALARNLEIVEIYSDKAISGTKEKRPGLDKMLLHARQRKFDYVLVWRLDRLGRNTKHLLTILDELQALQISLVSLQEGFDLSTYLGKAMATILSALASFERDLICERVRAGIANAKSKGVKLGRPSTIKPEIILELRAQGKTYREISKELSVSMGSIRDVLKLHNR